MEVENRFRRGDLGEEQVRLELGPSVLFVGISTASDNLRSYQRIHKLFSR